MDRRRSQPQKASHKPLSIEKTTAAIAERRHLLARLREGRMDTNAIRRELKIKSPATRARELIAQGHNIHILPIQMFIDDKGRQRVKIALYTLIRGDA